MWNWYDNYLRLQLLENMGWTLWNTKKLAVDFWLKYVEKRIVWNYMSMKTGYILILVKLWLKYVMKKNTAIIVFSHCGPDISKCCWKKSMVFCGCGSKTCGKTFRERIQQTQELYGGDEERHKLNTFETQLAPIPEPFLLDRASPLFRWRELWGSSYWKFLQLRTDFWSCHFINHFMVNSAQKWFEFVDNQLQCGNPNTIWYHTPVTQWLTIW